MKKTLIFFVLLFPFIVLGDVGHSRFDAASDTNVMYFVVPTLSLDWQAGIFNNDFPLGSYYQTQVWFDNYSVQECEIVHGSVALNTSDNSQDTISLVGHSSISEVDLFQSDTNSVDGLNCFTSANATFWVTYSNFNNSLDPINILTSFPGGSASTSVSSSSVLTVDNPAFDWFLGFVLFFMCMVFPIWLFRRK